MNDILKEAFSKLEHKLDYGDQTELTNQEIVILLRYICEIENREKALHQRIDKAIEYCNYGIKEWNTNDKFVEKVLHELKSILRGDINERRGND